MIISRKEQRCLDKLLELVASGIEFPDAVWKASNNGLDIDAARLGDLYDEACKNVRPIASIIAKSAGDALDAAYPWGYRSADKEP